MTSKPGCGRLDRPLVHENCQPRSVALVRGGSQDAPLACAPDLSEPPDLGFRQIRTQCRYDGAGVLGSLKDARNHQRFVVSDLTGHCLQAKVVVEGGRAEYVVVPLPPLRLPPQ